MFNDKQNLYAISTEGSLFGVDCEVITSTNYEEDEVTDFIKIKNHEIDEALVYQLGLGIVSNLHEQDDYYFAVGMCDYIKEGEQAYIERCGLRKGS